MATIWRCKGKAACWYCWARFGARLAGQLFVDGLGFLVLALLLQERGQGPGVVPEQQLHFGDGRGCCFRAAELPIEIREGTVDLSTSAS
jgi:hypothetical protein